MRSVRVGVCPRDDGGRAVKALVLRSIEDEGGQRCVDLRREVDGLIGWVECRRDPEDGHGWRVLGLGGAGFSSEAEALADARACVAWMEDVG